MGLKYISGVTTLPVSVAELKAQCRVDTSDDDTLFGLIAAAVRTKAEQFMGAAIMQRRVEQTLDAFPVEGEADVQIELPPAWNAMLPIAVPLSLVSITYVDTAGDTQTLATDQYTLDDRSWPFWVLPAADVDWPDTYDQANAVAIRYDTGYTQAADIPGDVRSWLLMTGAWLYENREAMVVSGRVAEIPGRFLDSLLEPYKVWRI